MSNIPLPPDMAKKWGHLRFLKYKGNNEWSAECPRCGDSGHNSPGDPDRFMIFGHNSGNSGKARGYCRRCGTLEWLDDQTNKPVSPQQQKANAQTRRDLAKLTEQRYRDRVKWLRSQQFWREYHDNMSSSQRRLWHDCGVGEWAIDLHKLGYAPKDDGALTIPYLNQEEKIGTLQYRLMKPPQVGDKYRFISGTRAQLFRVWPEEPLEGVILITEGAKKGIITFQNGPFTYQGKDVVIVSVPMKNVPERLIEKLKQASRLLWLLDPDAYQATKVNGKSQEPMINRNIKLAGPSRSRLVRAPDKIDDLFILGLSKKAFQAMLDQAEPLREEKK